MERRIAAQRRNGVPHAEEVDGHRPEIDGSWTPFPVSLTDIADFSIRQDARRRGQPHVVEKSGQASHGVRATAETKTENAIAVAVCLARNR